VCHDKLCCGQGAPPDPTLEPPDGSRVSPDPTLFVMLERSQAAPERTLRTVTAFAGGMQVPAHFELLESDARRAVYRVRVEHARPGTLELRALDSNDCAYPVPSCTPPDTEFTVTIDPDWARPSRSTAAFTGFNLLGGDLTVALDLEGIA